jgi:hypothetical protein
VGGYFLPCLPMAPVHVLVNNLLYDFSQVGPPPAIPTLPAGMLPLGPR